MAFIENFDRIYGEKLYTSNTLYKIERDSMTIAPYHHVLRLLPEVGKSSEPKTIVLMIFVEIVIFAFIFMKLKNYNFTI